MPALTPRWRQMKNWALGLLGVLLLAPAAAADPFTAIGDVPRIDARMGGVEGLPNPPPVLDTPAPVEGTLCLPQPSKMCISLVIETCYGVRLSGLTTDYRIAPLPYVSIGLPPQGAGGYGGYC
jgi:hypothetical protein